MQGCFSSVFGLVGAFIGLYVAISLFSNNDTVSPMRKLEIRCEEASKAQGASTNQREYFDACISAGASVIRAQERINQERNQNYSNSGISVGTEAPSPSSSQQSSLEVVPATLPSATVPTTQVTPEVPAATEPSALLKTPDTFPNSEQTQSTLESAAPIKCNGNMDCEGGLVCIKETCK